MNRNTLAFGFLLAVSILGCPRPKSPHETVKFEDSFVVSSALDKNSGLLTLRIRLKKGFHAYAQGEKIGKPLAVEIKAENGYHALGKPHLPAGRLKKLGANSQSHVLEGEFSVTQRLKIGTGVGKALLHMQICTADLCDRPRTHEINLKTL